MAVQEAEAGRPYHREVAAEVVEAVAHRSHQGAEEEEGAGEHHSCRHWGEEEGVAAAEERPKGQSFVRVAEAAAWGRGACWQEVEEEHLQQGAGVVQVVVQARALAGAVRESLSCGWLAVEGRCAGQRTAEAHQTGAHRCCCHRRRWPSSGGEAAVEGPVRLARVVGSAVAAASSNERTYRHRRVAVAQRIWVAGGKARVEVREVVAALPVLGRSWRHTDEEREVGAAVHLPVSQLPRRR